MRTSQTGGERGGNSGSEGEIKGGQTEEGRQRQERGGRERESGRERGSEHNNQTELVRRRMWVNRWWTEIT